MIPINSRDGAKLATAHAENILKYYSVYNSGRSLADIEAWIKTNLSRDLNFRKILSASQGELEQIAEKFQRKKTKPPFSTSITGIKGQYERFRTVKSSPFKTERL